MKKLMILLFLAASTLFSQSLTGYRLYVNPGHGGHDSDDRHILATDFWESEGNLTKGLKLRELLQDLGATVGISRVTNNTSDDLPLSTIGGLANNFNADYFHSIHSNAHNSQVNYVLLLYRGYDNSPVFPASKNMASIMWNQLSNTNRVYWQYSFENIRGDWTFYGSTSGLGVLRQLTMPGTLSEGSFHDYVPESWRLQSLDYRKHESWGIARSFLQFYNQPSYSHGIITGLVRDPNENVSYYSISSVNDHRKPVNYAKVTLQPGNKVFTTNNMNNGFYMFDSLAPGQYTVYFESPEYQLDSSVVNVQAGKTVFADAYLQFDTTIPPEITETTPADDAVDVLTTSSIQILFSRSMDTESAENAITISPEIEGTYEWTEDDMRLTFTPNNVMDVTTEYTFTITTDAKSIYDVNLTEGKVFSFTTNDRNQFAVEGSYPAEGATDISKTVQIRIAFDAPVAQSTISGKINLYDYEGTRISVKNASIFAEDDKGYIYFEPKDELMYHSNYSVVLSAGITDGEGYPLPQDFVLNFTTTGEEVASGQVLEDFEYVDDWTDPTENALSQNLNGDNSSIVTNAKRKVNGSKSMQFEYQFDAETGVAYIAPENDLYSVTSEGKMGIWVFGDMSNNTLELHYDLNGAEQVYTLDTLNYTGWRMQTIAVPVLGATDTLKLKGIVFNKVSEGAETGNIYFDDFQNEPTLTEVEEEVAAPNGYVLFQNYPNPFNPSTTIAFSLPESQKVTLKIYNILGAEVATLVDGQLSASYHQYKFDASNLASGIYIYQLQAGSFIQAKKFTLIK